MPYSVVYLGTAGLIPFILLPLVGSLDWLPLTTSARYFTQYSAVLLSFFGGIYWWDALSKREYGAQLYIAMLPTLLGWLCLVLAGHPFVLGLLSLCYLGVLFYDKQSLTLTKEEIVSYITLRMALTTVVVLSHGWMIILLF
ncbi:DUF3429 domain-containing protein [Alteromonas sp. C1M14]|uniref:DUF3429 domain-containing protein n=1 Tax=Alteromonas sp. C1M14 TaxID=2841567 RepID=UPI001C095391|nr:DUF3429 domain-containing protein [Alteromonas sp. C1M14]MBU2976971.1 DUF3429 domain-containing protein [Alteromonas sp. C1M14]